MASSDNLMTMEQQPWPFRPTFSDAWFADIFTKETETLTKALQQTFATASPNDDVLSAGMVESLFQKPDAAPVHTPSVSGGSENEVSVPKPRRGVPPSGRVTKRKSRASKRATTTFITADPANFRQMVQQVTGVRFGGFDGQVMAAPLLKPEPQRAAMSRFHPGGGLPTLDTSAFLLDGSASSLIAPPSTVVADGAMAGLDFESYGSFPTLESWKVM